MGNGWKFTLYDSLRTQRPWKSHTENTHKMRDHIVAILTEKAKRKGAVVKHENGRVIIPHCPQQGKNSNDCGLYICAYMAQLHRLNKMVPEEELLSPKEIRMMRLQIASKILEDGRKERRWR